MAAPLTADQVVSAMNRVGLPFREYPGWRERGLDRMRRKGFNPRGICIHHTAGNLGSRTVSQYIRDIINGDPIVPDKCHAVIAPDGTLWLNAAGRANHNAYVSQRALDAMLAGSFPTTGSVNYRGSLDTGNNWSYGVECIAAGVPNDAQRKTAVLWAAALCLAHGWSGGEVFGHGEVGYDRDWSDPGWNMGTFRQDVMNEVARRRRPLSPAIPTTPGASVPTTTDEEFIMAVEDKIVAAIEALGSKIGQDQSASDAYATKVAAKTGEYVHAYLRDRGLTVKLDDETIAKLAEAIKAEVIPVEAQEA